MTLVKSDIPRLLTAGLKTQFFQTFGAVPTTYDRLATVINSDKDTEQYAWLGALPGVREFLDERQEQDIAPYDYAIKNRTWESTISIDRTALEDDLYGQITLRIKEMAQAARQHLDILTFGLLATGFTAKCYDGAAFFGSHTQGGLAQSNKGTDALSSASLQAAITAMMRFQDDQGKPAGVMPDTLIVSPENWWEAWTLLNSAYFPDPVTAASQQIGANPLKGMLLPIASPYLPSAGDWFVCDSKRTVRAIVLQLRKQFEFEALDGGTENSFLRDKYLYGVRARYNVGFGDWRAAYGAQVA